MELPVWRQTSSRGLMKYLAQWIIAWMFYSISKWISSPLLVIYDAIWRINAHMDRDCSSLTSQCECDIIGELYPCLARYFAGIELIASIYGACRRDFLSFPVYVHLTGHPVCAAAVSRMGSEVDIKLYAKMNQHTVHYCEERIELEVDCKWCVSSAEVCWCRGSPVECTCNSNIVMLFRSIRNVSARIEVGYVNYHSLSCVRTAKYAVRVWSFNWLTFKLMSQRMAMCIREDCLFARKPRRTCVVSYYVYESWGGRGERGGEGERFLCYLRTVALEGWAVGGVLAANR
jgi:hypothetical protein